MMMILRRSFCSLIKNSSSSSSSIPILYEDNHVLIANKPCGVLSQEVERDGDCLIKRLRNDDRRYLRSVHRLDRVVSGCVCVGKSSKATKRLSDMFRNRRNVEKRYFACVRGIPEEEIQKKITHRLVPGKGRRGLTRTSSDLNAREAVLTYEPVRSIVIHDKMRSQPCTLLDIHLVTGIKHQIRAQLASVNLPIINDTRYDDSVTQRRSKYGIIALHAYYLSFEHPVRGNSPVQASCEIPWDAWEEQLGLFRAA